MTGTSTWVDDVRELLLRDETDAVRDRLKEIHAADIAEGLVRLEPAFRQRVIELMPAVEAAETLEQLNPETRGAVLAGQDSPHIDRILEEMGNDTIADLLSESDQREATQILSLLDDDEAQDVRELLEYLEDTAGGRMTTEFVAVADSLTAQEVIQALRRMAPSAETVYYVYVVDEDDRLQGVLSLRELIVAPPDQAVRELMQTRLITLPPETDQEEVAQTVAKYDLLAVPIVDDRQRLLGIVTVDDILDVVEEEATEDIFRLSGHPVEAVNEEVPLLRWVWARTPWLLLLLAGQLLAASVIGGFESILEQVVLLAFFIPVLTGMAGNVGTQSLAVAVRGLAVGGVDHSRLRHTLLRETQTGLLLGIGLGIVASAVTAVVFGAPEVGFVIGIAMITNLTIGALMGTLVPFVLDRLGFDPAVASGPFVTTTLDVVGLYIYFVIATRLLGQIG